MTNVKQDLTLYKELKKVKSEFDKEVKSAKSSINRNNFSEAKTSLSKCEGYINNMESIIDKLPDKSTVDTAKKTLFFIVSSLTSLVANLAYFNNKENKLDKQRESINNEYIKNKNDFDKTMVKLNKNTFARMKKDDEITAKLGTNNKELESLYSEIHDMDKEWSKLFDKIPEIDKNIESNKKDYDNITKKIKNIDKERLGSSAISGIGIGTATALIKPLKQKAKNILKKCKKILSNTKAYLDKVEKMSKAVKESFDETLDSLYEAFTEGTIDEFEYDTLMDHLLN